MLRQVILLLCSFYVNGLTCPPSCEPPTTEGGCKAYTVNAACSQDVRDISTSEAHCGCLWQTYIQTVEPEAKVIFSDEGKQCYTWAAKLCSILEQSEKTLLKQAYLPEKTSELKIFRDEKELENVLRRIQQLESVQIVGGHKTEKAKHRRRNGVGTISKEIEYLLNKEKQELINAHKDAPKQKKTDGELKKMGRNLKGMHMQLNKMHEDAKNAHGKMTEIDGEFIGKPGQCGSASWVEGVPEKAILEGAIPPDKSAISPRPPQVKSPVEVKKIYTVRRHWIDLDMPVDQFKLGVFMIILLLNILVVVVLIFCRESGDNKKQIEAKPTGDLDSSVLPYPPDGSHRQSDGMKSKLPVSEYVQQRNSAMKMNENSSNFIHSFRKKMQGGSKKKNASDQFLQMMEVHPNDFTKNGNAYSKIQENSPFIQAGMHQSPQKISHGLYENVDEEPENVLDNTYEELLPRLSSHPETRQYYKRKYSLKSESHSEDGSSPTKYFPRYDDTSSKSVSFSLSPRTYLTLQDRMVIQTTSRRRRRKRGLMMPFRMSSFKN